MNISIDTEGEELKKAKEEAYKKAHPWEFSVKVLRDIPLSEQDIKKYLGANTRIFKYSEIMGCKSINELLGRQGYCIILLETQPNFGHWICLKKNIRSGLTIISFFDSYGGFPDKQKRFIGEDFLARSHQQYNKLCELLHEISFHNNTVVEFSHKAFQNMAATERSTCGHWCCVFIDSNLTVKEFNEYIDKFDEPNKDDLVVKIFYKDKTLLKPKKQKLSVESILKD